jgi:hypothetical protein
VRTTHRSSRVCSRHRAQSKSLQQLCCNPAPHQIDVVGISFEKGGTSVLADGYLVAGSLTAAQPDWIFGFGVLTQLLDDLDVTYIQYDPKICLPILTCSRTCDIICIYMGENISYIVILDSQEIGTFWAMNTGAGQATISITLPYRLEAGTVFSHLDDNDPSQRVVNTPVWHTIAGL